MARVAHLKLSRYPPPMSRVAFSYWLIQSPGRKPPHRSACRLTAADAAAMGAVGIVPGSTKWIDVPDTNTEAERLAFYAGHPSAGRDGVKPPNP
jgi:hypothetical protein